MAKKNYTPNPDGLSAEDRALNAFASLMIQKINDIQSDWKKPWFSPQSAQLPQNLSGRYYNGMNSIVLMLMQEKNKWQTSRFATFDRIMSLNFTQGKDGRKAAAVDADGSKLPHVGVNKGEKSTPVMLTVFTCVNSETKERIKYDDYRQMSEEERAKYHVYPKLQVYNVFNLDQTNIKEARPELYQKFVDEKEGQQVESRQGMRNFPALDAMIKKDLYVCPIKPTHGDEAYYSISKDVIVVPEKSQFVDGEAFCSNLLHEMSHASGAENRLGRLKPGQAFGSEAYAKEELVAELTAALVSTKYGMEKHVKTDSAAYLKSWLNSLHENPEFIKSSLLDVKRSASFISQRLDAVNMRLEQGGWEADFSDIRQQNKTYSPMFSSKAEKPAHTIEEKPVEKEETKVQETEKEEVAAKNIERPHFHR